MTLPRLFGSLAQQTHSPHQIVVVDSGSTDETLKLVEHHGATIITYPPKHEYNYAKALNLGIPHCTEKLVLVLSSHMEFRRSDTLAIMLRLLTTMPISAVYCEPRRQPPITTPSDQVRFYSVYPEVFRGNNFLSNSCALFRREDVISKPFDESFPTAEDQAWALTRFNETGQPTVCLQIPWIYYGNPHTIADSPTATRKLIQETVTIAIRLYPPARSIRQIIRTALNASWNTLRGRLARARTLWQLAWALAKSHWQTPHYTSRYFNETASGGVETQR